MVVRKARLDAKMANPSDGLQVPDNGLRIASHIARPFLIGAILACACFLALAAKGATTTGDPKGAVRPNNLGVAYMNQQKAEDALAQFKLAIAADPSLAIPHMNVGIVLLVLQRRRDCIRS